jgi:hypothetical protein
MTESTRISRAQGPITIDGRLNDKGWRTASQVATWWYETNPGDKTAAAVRSAGWLAYDDHYFYAAFDFEDPNPRAIRWPYADHDHLSGNYTDYGGVILETRNDGRSAVLPLASPSASNTTPSPTTTVQVKLGAAALGCSRTDAVGCSQLTL